MLWLSGAVGYMALSHLLMVHAADRPWAVAALFGPMLLAVAGAAAQRRHAPTLALVAAGGALLLALVAAGGLGDVKRLYVAQHAGVHALLFAACAASLRPGRLSWIGQAAQRVHGALSPSMAAYTRGLTRLWAAYFALMALASLAVYAACDWATWSLLANVATPALIALFVAGEYVLRYRLHPEFARATFADSVRAWSRPARPVPPRRAAS